MSENACLRALKVQSRSTDSSQSLTLYFTATTSPEIINDTCCSELINLPCLPSDLSQLGLIVYDLTHFHVTSCLSGACCFCSQYSVWEEGVILVQAAVTDVGLSLRGQRSCNTICWEHLSC